MRQNAGLAPEWHSYQTSILPMQATENWRGFPAHKALRCASLLAIAMGALAAGVMLLQQMPIQYLGPQFSLTGIGIMSLFLVKRGDLREGARALVWGTWLIVSLMAMTGQGIAMGDVPAGYYALVGNVNGESVRAEFFVRANETTFVEVRTKQ